MRDGKGPDGSRELADGLIAALVAWVRVGGKPEHFRDGLMPSVEARALEMPEIARDGFRAFCLGMVNSLIYQYREGFIDDDLIWP